jgi:hypothetical protein
MDFATIANLGIGGFAILVMWWMYQSSAQERNEHFKAFRELESDIRNKFAAQLMENTNAMLEHSKVMRTVMELLSKLHR